MAVKKGIPRVYLLLAALLIVVTAAGGLVYLQFIQTYHYEVVTPEALYRTGFRSLRELNTTLNTAPHRPAIVVSLVDATENAKEPFSQEADFCRKSRVKYRSIPVQLGGWPTTEQVREFLKITEGKVRPTLVHCAQGVRRTGMFVAAYQMSVLGWDKEKTKAAILTFGHSNRTVNDIKKFIDIYDPQTRTVMQELEPSKE